VEAVVKRFKTDLHNCVGFIQEPKKLKENVKGLYTKYVQDETVRRFRSRFRMTVIKLRYGRTVTVPWPSILIG
jgi:hypothetical protein